MASYRDVHRSRKKLALHPRVSKRLFSASVLLPFFCCTTCSSFPQLHKFPFGRGFSSLPNTKVATETAGGIQDKEGLQNVVCPLQMSRLDHGELLQHEDDTGVVILFSGHQRNLENCKPEKLGCKNSTVSSPVIAPCFSSFP